MTAARPPAAGTTGAAEPEWAIAAGLHEIAAAEAADVLEPLDGGWSATVAGGETVVFRRLYAGAEFCRHLIPSRAQWAKVLALADRRRIPVTLQTPPVTEGDLASIESLLAPLSDANGAEVVANDWGTLRLVRRRFPHLRPILGRCLRRQKKDPRFTSIPGPEAVSRDLLELLARWGVDLVEADWLPDAASPIALAMHLPFAFAASGSLCALSGLDRPVAEKFRPDQPCRARCRGHWVELDHPDCRTPLVLRGNTCFFPNRIGVSAQARPDIARFVYDLDTDVERRFLDSRIEGRP